MRSLASRSILLVAVLLAGGCASTLPSEPPVTSPPLTAPPGGMSPSPPAEASPSLPPSLSGSLTCNDDPEQTFEADVFRLPPTAELDANPAAAALRGYIAEANGGDVGTTFPAHGWRAAIVREDDVLFLAPGDGTWFGLRFTASGGAWEFSEGGECRLAVVLPPGVGFAAWRLDPAQSPDPASSEVHVLATEIACASGQPPLGRVLAPVVLETDDSVTIAIEVGTRPGDQECPGNPEVSLVIPLAAPLGSRPLFDASTVPPARRDPE